ncbi:MAG TPA: serine/threonine-protein kinase [Steroidobacteraceae bacterium]|jgi:eukaryotic-like serine/threonine-protein kinase|nr:serine/threonine-protein kinase [Steroidobacteraceae bacterium]
MTERVLIMRHASGLVNRARRVAIERWPNARLEVHDLAAYGKPPSDFRWDRYAHMLIDDEYLRREGLLWLSELRSKPNFPKIVRVPNEGTRHKPPAEIEVKAPPLPPKRDPKPSASSPAAEIRPIRQDRKSTSRPEVIESPSMIQRADAKRLADAETVLKAAGIQGFTPVKPLGSGATANVCLCERANKQQVVLKILKSEGSGDSDLLSRFVQEYFAASSIDSPYVAKVFEHGFSESHAYIVMEYFPAGDLRARIARDRPGAEEAFIIIGSILSALTSVHAAGIIHRDLKPANVMFRDDGTIALVDFGSARRDADPVAKTLAGVVIGTPYYLSPEQALGGTADERSDLYSVGVMLYELLTGQRMYAAGSLVALFEMHKTAPIPKLPESLMRHQRFLERLVAKRPEERYRSAAEALDALMEYISAESEKVVAA